MKLMNPDDFSEVWSATPTPFDENYRIDEASVVRLVRHHLQLSVKGLFLAGTCGEGPWMRDDCRWRLLRTAVAAAEGKMRTAMQVSDNSAARILENIDAAYHGGADMVVIAEPFFLMNATPGNLIALYEKAVSGSSLPVCIYNRGRHANVKLPAEVLKVIYQLPGVVAIKDSSADPASREIALEARRKRPELRLLNGDEFLVSEHFEAGYDSVLLGGCVFNAGYARAIRDAWRQGDQKQALRLNEAMKELNWTVYGGRDNACWLAGLKHLLVKMGIFSTENHFLNFSLSTECAAAIEDLVQRGNFLQPEVESTTR